MPPLRTLGTVRPVKTERTHEENQERAYIAASRRSDRSLEARVESARRASEIHKKRTGRALRVTEQDVVNEEMYEEEDDDIPTQYQRLSAHLQTSSMMFNRRLQNYLATQMAVRNGSGISQPHPGIPMLGYGHPFLPNATQFPSTINPHYLPNSMLLPQAFNQIPQTNHQSTQAFNLPPHIVTSSPQALNQSQPTFCEIPQSDSYSPYNIPPRPQAHHRSASIPTPQQMPSFQESTEHIGTMAGLPRGDDSRRMSLPPQAEALSHQSPEDQMRPSLSRLTTSHSAQKSSSPLADGTPTSHMEKPPTTSTHMPTAYGTTSQIFSMNPLSMSLPPESQQFVGPILDPFDPYTSMFMADSEHVSQPTFPGTYSYNPNPPPKSPRTASGAALGAAISSSPVISGMNQTLAPGESIHLNTAAERSSSNNPHSAVSDALVSPFGTVNSPEWEYGSISDAFQPNGILRTNSNQGSLEDFDDQWLNTEMYSTQS